MISKEQRAHDLAVAITQSVVSKNLDSVYEDFSAFDPDFFAKCCTSYEAFYNYFTEHLSD